MTTLVLLLILAAVLDRGRTIAFLGGVWSAGVVVFWVLAAFALFVWGRTSGWI